MRRGTLRGCGRGRVTPYPFLFTKWIIKMQLLKRVSWEHTMSNLKIGLNTGWIPRLKLLVAATMMLKQIFQRSGLCIGYNTLSTRCSNNMGIDSIKWFHCAFMEMRAGQWNERTSWFVRWSLFWVVYKMVELARDAPVKLSWCQGLRFRPTNRTHLHLPSIPTCFGLLLNS